MCLGSADTGATVERHELDPLLTWCYSTVRDGRVRIGHAHTTVSKYMIFYKIVLPATLEAGWIGCWLATPTRPLLGGLHIHDLLQDTSMEYPNFR